MNEPDSDAITYHGRIIASGAAPKIEVVDHGKSTPLPARDDLIDLRAEPFDWGDRAAGSTKLALALCAHALADDQRAVRVHERFRDEVVSIMADDRWVLTKAGIAAVVDTIERVGQPI